MALLTIRNVPESLYNRLQQRAKAQHRSLSAEVIALLEDALLIAENHVAQANILERMRRHRHAFHPVEIGAPDSVTLLHEDRDR